MEKVDNNIEIVGEMVIYTIIWSSMPYQMDLSKADRSYLGSIHFALYFLLALTSISFNVTSIPSSISSFCQAIEDRTKRNKKQKVFKRSHI
jgi:hypothetical protein